MRKDWLWIALASTVLAACTTDIQQQAPVQQQPAYSGPVVEIGGVEPRYEPFNPAAGQDYAINGKNYKIVKDPTTFSETGLASSYGEEASGNRTTSGEEFDANAIAAAHPTLPLPSYVRVTNLANGRMIVVRVNDRGPYTPGRIIDLTTAAADRLNISKNTKVRLDYIAVAADGSLSGPGTVGTSVAKQSYALPARPNISSGVTGTAAIPADDSPAVPAANPVDSRPVTDSTLSNNDSLGAPVRSAGFLGATQPLRSGVLESSEPAAAPDPTPAVAAVTASAAVSSPADNSANYVVQVSALSDASRAHQLATRLGKQFGVSSAVDSRGNVYRVQLGRFNSRQQAAALQQRLVAESQQQSFITVAPDAN